MLWMYSNTLIKEASEVLKASAPSFPSKTDFNVDLAAPAAWRQHLQR